MNAKFGFLTQDLEMQQMNRVLMKQLMCEAYDEIISRDLKDEVQTLRRRLSSYQEITPTEVNNWGAIELLQWIVKWGYTKCLSNLAVALRIFITMRISVATCERSFSKLKLIKTYLRSTMS